MQRNPNKKPCSTVKLIKNNHSLLSALKVSIRSQVTAAKAALRWLRNGIWHNIPSDFRRHDKEAYNLRQWHITKPIESLYYYLRPASIRVGSTLCFRIISLLSVLLWGASHSMNPDQTHSTHRAHIITSFDKTCESLEALTK